MTDSALVADARDVGLVTLVVAEWAVAEDAIVADGRDVLVWNRVIDGCKTVTWMSVASILHALAAEVPVWAAQALVTHAVDLTIASVANGVVTNVATW